MIAIRRKPVLSQDCHPPLVIKMLQLLLTLMKIYLAAKYLHPKTTVPRSEIKRWNSTEKFHLLIWSVTRDQKINILHDLPTKLMFHFLLKALAMSRWKLLLNHQDPSKGFYHYLQRPCGTRKLKPNGLSPSMPQRNWIL